MRLFISGPGVFLSAASSARHNASAGSFYHTRWPPGYHSSSRPASSSSSSGVSSDVLGPSPGHLPTSAVRAKNTGSRVRTLCNTSNQSPSFVDESLGNYHRIFQDGLQYNLHLAHTYGGALKIHAVLGVNISFCPFILMRDASSGGTAVHIRSSCIAAHRD